jgi:hypothetical protein
MTTRPTIRIRATTYRREAGWLIFGVNARGQRVSIFTPSTFDEASRIATAEREGVEWTFA